MATLLKFDPETGRPLPRPMTREELRAFKANPYNHSALSRDPEHCSVPHVDDSMDHMILSEDEDHCVMKHENDPVYAVNRPSSLENLIQISYPVEARKAFLYNEIFGRPLSHRRRMLVR